MMKFNVSMLTILACLYGSSAKLGKQIDETHLTICESHQGSTERIACLRTEITKLEQFQDALATIQLMQDGGSADLLKTNGDFVEGEQTSLDEEWV